MKIVLAFDSFKGSLTAEEAVEAAREGVLSVFPEAEVVGLPLADGGEGTTAALSRFFDAEGVLCEVHDPLFRKIEASYVICTEKFDENRKLIAKKTAIMEMSSAAGLTLLSENERTPMQTTTFGVGEMLLDAIRRGCKHILIGIGGSATNDCGMGMLAALGVRFLDEKDEELLPVGGNLLRVKRIDFDFDISGVTIDVVCDVQNPLFGKEGAAYVYAPQKGATTKDVEKLDRGLRHFACLCDSVINKNVIKANRSTELEVTPGSGAAGGLGFGLLLVGAKLRRGVDVIMDTANLDEYLKDSDLVITGEGKIDRQTLNGKLPYGVLQKANFHNVPVIVLAGMVEDEAELIESGFRYIYSINPPEFVKGEAINTENAKRNLSNTARLCCIDYKNQKF